ncbi:hypothetical protein CALVIDRAFT_203118 [Calocera viscosa TUFC12733]|uniref:Uncharacterized protein n=1 Tax=Calocera viscosa (strain TUFC12733) TaxID=1330018 RepID=A0A167KBX3_CALVF|nr:hypothetical protein CALVIDRAFT_203118 [Calocera viscosa TUFC12733]
MEMRLRTGTGTRLRLRTRLRRAKTAFRELVTQAKPGERGLGITLRELKERVKCERERQPYPRRNRRIMYTGACRRRSSAHEAGGSRREAGLKLRLPHLAALQDLFEPLVQPPSQPLPLPLAPLVPVRALVPAPASPYGRGGATQVAQMRGHLLWRCDLGEGEGCDGGGEEEVGVGDEGEAFAAVCCCAGGGLGGGRDGDGEEEGVELRAWGAGGGRGGESRWGDGGGGREPARDEGSCALPLLEGRAGGGERGGGWDAWWTRTAPEAFGVLCCPRPLARGDFHLYVFPRVAGCESLDRLVQD